MIEIKDIPERKYILIHPANKPSEVKGCIAVGVSRNEVNSRINLSRKAYYPIYDVISSELFKGGDISIRILEGGKRAWFLVRFLMLQRFLLGFLNRKQKLKTKGRN